MQIKRFLSMRDALQQLVESEEYTRFEFENDMFATRLSRGEVWRLMARVTQAAGPVLLLLRLADSNVSSLSKLKGTVDYVTSLMVDSGDNTLEDQIAVAFHNRAPELECDVANAAYVLDAQFVPQSRNVNADVMKSFWKVSRDILRIEDNVEWNRVRQNIVSELAAFRMKTGGFALEGYGVDTCAFWAVAGCHAPTLRKLALCLTSLPCSSGEAERTWQEVKLNMTKKRNRIARDKVEKMVFVRRFMNLKRKLFSDDKDESGFKEWVQDLFVKSLSKGWDREHEDRESSDDIVSDTFKDRIEPGEQGKINGKESDKPTVTLTQLKKDNG